MIAINYPIRRQTVRRHTGSKVPAGITLLEVLISMFIMAMGLLGLAALLPVGAHQLAVADKVDRGSALGRAAFRDVQVRGMLSPHRWLLTETITDTVLDPTAATGAPANTRYRTYSALGQDPFNRGQYTSTARLPPLFVIDPLFISQPALDGGSPPVSLPCSFPFSFNGLGETGVFPLLNAPPIPRLTILMPDPDGSGTATSHAMTYLEAERIFRSGDDLAFQIPATGPAADLPEAFRRPTPQYLATNVGPDGQPGIAGFDDDGNGTDDNIEELGTHGSDDNVQRQFEGLYTYMVMVAPDLLESGNNASSVRKATVSVVVFYNRKLVPDLIGAGDGMPSERMVYCDIPTGGGIGGGDVQLRINSIVGSLNTSKWLHVRPGQWVLLSGFVTDADYPAGNDVSPTYTGTQRPVAAWYRIVGTDAGSRASGAQFVRSVTLSGPDWIQPSTAVFVDADGDSATGLTAYATICSEVVAVYTKTIDLDMTSPRN